MPVIRFWQWMKANGNAKKVEGIWYILMNGVQKDGIALDRHMVEVNRSNLFGYIREYAHMILYRSELVAKQTLKMEFEMYQKIIEEIGDRK